MIKVVYTGAQLYMHGSYYACDIYQMPSGVLVIRFNTNELPDNQVRIDKVVKLFDEDEYNLWFTRDGVAIAEFKAVKFNDSARSYAEQNGMVTPIEG